MSDDPVRFSLMSDDPVRFSLMSDDPVRLDALYGAITSTYSHAWVGRRSAQEQMLANVGLFNDPGRIDSSDGKCFVPVELTPEQRHRSRLNFLGLTPERRGVRMEAKLARRRAAIRKRRMIEWSVVLGALAGIPLVVAALAYCWKLGIYSVMG